VTQFNDLPVESITCRAGFVAEVELGPAFSQLLDHSCDGCGFGGNVTQKPNLTVAFAVGDRHRNLKLRRVQANESYVLACHVWRDDQDETAYCRT